MKTIGTIVLAIGAALLVATPSRANIVANPGFETGDFTDWTLGGDTTFVFVDSVSPHSGTFGAVFGPFNLGTLSQVLATTAGTEYDLSFWLQNDGPGANSFSISWNGTQLDTLTNRPAFDYTEFTYTGLLATSTATTLQFGYFNTDSLWEFDDVSVDAAVVGAVPEPGTLALIASGLIGLGAIRRRK